MASELREVKFFFQGKNITLSDEWLSHCISWYKEEHANYTQSDLQTQVYEQWLLHDFRDVKISILPPNAKKEIKLIINQSICLQLQSIIDISKPKLLQIQAIRNPKNQSNNTDENTTSGKRVLQLTLTDGVQEITATEYRPVKVLNINLSPGIKVKLNGPITIRRGTVMLEDNSIKILGGEVEELLIENAAENVLAKSLGLPLSENPTVMRETMVTADQEIIRNLGNNLQPIRPNNNITNKPKPANQTSINQYLQPKRPKTPELFDDNFDEADFDEIDFDEIDPPKPKKEPFQPTNQFKTANISTNNQFKTANISTNNQFKTENTSTNNEFKMDFDPDEFEEMMQLDEIKEEHATPPVQQAMERKAMPIAKLLKIMGNVTKGKFMINAKFESVVQKLVITDDAFSIKLCVKDDSGELVVAVHCDVISDMMGYDPTAIMEMRQRIREKDPTISETLMKALDGFKQKLLDLDTRMDVLLESQQEPTIIKLYE